jgi:hypothetical protein
VIPCFALVRRALCPSSRQRHSQKRLNVKLRLSSTRRMQAGGGQSIQVSGVQINPNGEQLRAEEADRGGIAGAARQLIREPVLALAWIIVGE